MQKNIFETLIGFLVLVGASILIYAAYSLGKTNTNSGYVLNARFDRIDGLVVGSDVMISGIKIGSVLKQKIEPETYLAEISMVIDSNIKLPEDSSAAIVSTGLLGGKYVSLVPGGSNIFLKNGEQITFTESSINFESLLGKFIFNDKESKTEEESFEF